MIQYDTRKPLAAAANRADAVGDFVACEPNSRSADVDRDHRSTTTDP